MNDFDDDFPPPRSARRSRRRKRDGSVRQAPEQLSVLADAPQIANLPKRTRDRVAREAERRSRLGGMPEGLIHVAAFLGTIVVTGACALTAWLVFGIPQAMFAMSPLAITGLIVPTQFFLYLHLQKYKRRQLAEVLLEENLRPSRCPICSYRLRGTTTETCPECGQALAPPPPPEDDAQAPL